MKPIGTFLPSNPFFLAPMEAVNCASFRLLCKKRGASLVYTDMIDADVFMSAVEKEGEHYALDKYLNKQDDELPLSIQIGGANIENLTATAKILQPHATLIDYNVGCPLPSMLGKKGGVYLSKHPDQLKKRIEALREVITIPFTVKIRSGWDEQSINAVDVSLMLQELGVDAVALHPRTRKQRYQDRADWVLAREVSEALTIPFILSGDVTNAYMAEMAFSHVKCDYIMIARGAKANPSVFKDILDWYNTKKQLFKPETLYDKKGSQPQKDFLEWLELYKKREKRYHISEIRDHAIWTASESQHSKKRKAELLECETEEEIVNIVKKLQF